MEKLCYEEPISCYSCNNSNCNENIISCPQHGCSFKAFFDSSSESYEDDMKIEYRRAVTRGKNCSHYTERNIAL